MKSIYSKPREFAFYRVKMTEEGKRIEGRTYHYVREEHLQIRIDNYRLLYVEQMRETKTAREIAEMIREQSYGSKKARISDVLVVNFEGEIRCYYLDEEWIYPIYGFLQFPRNGSVIDDHTKDFIVTGYSGKWRTVDSVLLDGQYYYLLEHQTYGRQVQTLLMDSYGKLIWDKANVSIDEQAVQKIRESVQSSQDEFPDLSSMDKQAKVQRLVSYQKYFVHGTWVRQKESGTELNYNMIDGISNNSKGYENRKIIEQKRKD